MPLLHMIVLSVVQGITEFLPISSSGHLVLVPLLNGWKDQGLSMDVAMHVGTLGAVMAYLWRDIVDMLVGLGRMLKGKGVNEHARLAFYLIAATLPVIAAGLAMDHYYPDGIRSMMVIGWTTLGFGVVLWLTDRFGVTIRKMQHLKLFDVMIIGFAQCIALIPGTSRSGITMTAGRLLGMERQDCARFSMLMSIPTIIGAGVLKGYDLYKAGDVVQIDTALSVAGLAFVSAFIAIALMMKWLKKASFTPFVIYRIILGGFLLALSYGYLSL